MKIIVVGDGKVGSTLVSQLAQEGHDVTVIDNNPNVLRRSTDTLDVMGVEGNGASYEVQMEAGVNDADLLIAATNADELNILACMLAKKLGAKHTIARVRNPEYTKQLQLMREELGLSMYINPEYSAAVEIGRIIRFPSAITMDSFAKGRVELVEIKIGKGSPLIGKPLYTLGRTYNVKVLICAVQRGSEVIIPSGHFVLEEGDKINITADPKEIEQFFAALGILKQRIRTAIIAGGGRITYYLATILLQMGVKVKIIERDAARCEQLCELVPKATLICGDATDEELLLEEGIDGTDAFAALIDNDEENIIISMYATSMGANKVITKVNRLSFTGIMERAGIDSVISPKFITADLIVRYVRAMQNSLGNNAETLHKIVDNKVEAVEFIVREQAPYLGKSLKELKLKPDLLLASIIRKGRPIVPRGDDTIELGDSVVVVTSTYALKDLSDILA